MGLGEPCLTETVRHDPPGRRRHVDRALGVHRRSREQGPHHPLVPQGPWTETSTRSCASSTLFKWRTVLLCHRRWSWLQARAWLCRRCCRPRTRERFGDIEEVTPYLRW